MQLEAAHAVEITKLVEYVDRKKDPLIQVVRTKHRLSSDTDSQMPEDRSTERNKKNEGQHSGKKKKDGTGRGCMEN